MGHAVHKAAVVGASKTKHFAKRTAQRTGTQVTHLGDTHQFSDFFMGFSKGALATSEVMAPVSALLGPEVGTVVAGTAATMSVLGKASGNAARGVRALEDSRPAKRQRT